MVNKSGNKTCTPTLYDLHYQFLQRNCLQNQRSILFIRIQNGGT